MSWRQEKKERERGRLLIYRRSSRVKSAGYRRHVLPLYGMGVYTCGPEGHRAPIFFFLIH
jgi:hypothetical protein